MLQLATLPHHDHACSNSSVSLATEHQHLPKKYKFFSKEITSCLVAPQEPVGRTLALCPATHLQGELVRLSQQHKVCLGFWGYRGWGLYPCYVPPGRAGAAESTAQDVSRVSGLWLGGCLPSISTVL